MINELYEQLKTACNNEERGKITSSEYNIALSLIVSMLYNDLFNNNRAVINKKNKYNLPAEDSDGKDVTRQVLDYYLVENTTLNIINRKAQLPSDLFFIYSLTNDKGVELDKLPLNKFNIYLSSKSKPTSCYPSYTQYGNTIEIYPACLVNISYYRKHKIPKRTFSIIGDKELFNPSASDFQDIDIHYSLKDKIFNELLFYFGINRKDQIVQQAGTTLIANEYQKSKAV